MLKLELVAALVANLPVHVGEDNGVAAAFWADASQCLLPESVH